MSIPMLLVDVTYILNSGKVKVRVINMQALPIQCVLTLWIQIVVMVHVYCVGSHMYTTDCDITFLVFQCTLLQSSPSEENSAHFLQVQPITTCTVTTISFHQVPIGLSVQGQHWLETSTSTSIYDLWWDLLILNFMFFLISHNFHSYDCDSIMMTVMSRL